MLGVGVQMERAMSEVAAQGKSWRERWVSLGEEGGKRVY